MLTVSGGHEKGIWSELPHDLPLWLETVQEEIWWVDQAERATRISLIGQMMYWQSELKATTALQSGPAVLLCDIPPIWLTINVQLLQKLKWCWNNNSIKGADGPMSKRFTKDWVDIIRLISQWLKNDSWGPMRWNFGVLLYRIARGQEYSWIWPDLKNTMKLVQTQVYQYG